MSFLSLLFMTAVFSMKRNNKKAYSHDLDMDMNFSKSKRSTYKDSYNDMNENISSYNRKDKTTSFIETDEGEKQVHEAERKRKLKAEKEEKRIQVEQEAEEKRLREEKEIQDEKELKAATYIQSKFRGDQARKTTKAINERKKQRKECAAIFDFDEDKQNHINSVVDSLKDDTNFLANHETDPIDNNSDVNIYLKENFPETFETIAHLEEKNEAKVQERLNLNSISNELLTSINDGFQNTNHGADFIDSDTTRSSISDLARTISVGIVQKENLSEAVKRFDLETKAEQQKLCKEILNKFICDTIEKGNAIKHPSKDAGITLKIYQECLGSLSNDDFNCANGTEENHKAFESKDNRMDLIVPSSSGKSPFRQFIRDPAAEKTHHDNFEAWGPFQNKINDESKQQKSSQNVLNKRAHDSERFYSSFEEFNNEEDGITQNDANLSKVQEKFSLNALDKRALAMDDINVEKRKEITQEKPVGLMDAEGNYAIRQRSQSFEDASIKSKITQNEAKSRWKTYLAKTAKVAAAGGAILLCCQGFYCWYTAPQQASYCQSLTTQTDEANALAPWIKPLEVAIKPLGCAAVAKLGDLSYSVYNTLFKTTGTGHQQQYAGETSQEFGQGEKTEPKYGETEETEQEYGEENKQEDGEETQQEYGKKLETQQKYVPAKLSDSDVYNRFFKPSVGDCPDWGVHFQRADCSKTDPSARNFSSHQEMLDIIKQISNDKTKGASLNRNAHLKK